jgi:hypothetical protein
MLYQVNGMLRVNLFDSLRYSLQRHAKAILEATNDFNHRITETIEDNGALILEAIEDACGKPSRNRQLLLSNVAQCNSKDRAVTCGFDSAHASIDKKTLFVEEGMGKVDTGIFVNVKVSTEKENGTHSLILSGVLTQEVSVTFIRMPVLSLSTFKYQ